jgi:hypothetical protein
VEAFKQSAEKPIKMNSHIKFLLSFIVLAGLFLASCKKEEGVGGTNKIIGKVMIRQYNSNFTVMQEQYYATDEDVFIIYGDDEVYGDKTSTTYDGTYEFNYLREGKYTLYAYSKDSAGYPSKKMIPVIVKVDISGKKKTAEAETIVILK